MTKNLQVLEKSIQIKKVHIRIGDGDENFGIKLSLIYITIPSEHYMPKYIIYIEITLFKKHVQNVVGIA